MLYGGTVLSTRNARQAVGIAKLLNRDVAIVGPLRSTSMDAVGDVLCVCVVFTSLHIRSCRCCSWNGFADHHHCSWIHSLTSLRDSCNQCTRAGNRTAARVSEVHLYGKRLWVGRGGGILFSTHKSWPVNVAFHLYGMCSAVCMGRNPSRV